VVIVLEPFEEVNTLEMFTTRAIYQPTNIFLVRKKTLLSLIVVLIESKLYTLLLLRTTVKYKVLASRLHLRNPKENVRHLLG
jgi:hypothetical protein